MKNKWIKFIIIGFVLPVFLIVVMMAFSQIMTGLSEVWAEKAMDLSLIQRLLLSFAYFLRTNFILLTLAIFSLCLSIAVIILVLSITQRNFEDKKGKLVGIGELLKGSWQLYKENFGILIKVTFVPLFLVFSLWLIKTLYPFSFSLKYILFQIISTVLSSFIFCWLTANLVFSVKNREKKIDFKEALKSGTKWILPLFWLSILSSIVVLGGTMLLIIPGIILSVWFCLASYVLIYEDKRGMEALLKSKDIISGNWWSVFWRMVIIFVIGLLIFLPFLFFYFPLLFSKEIVFATYSFFSFEFLFMLFFFPFSIIYSALIYENLSLIKKIEFKATLKRKLKYLLPAILAIVIIGAIGGLIFGGLYFGYKAMIEEEGGRETIDLAKVGFKLEMYYKEKGGYPGVFGSNQWNILESELKSELPKGDYEYWVSDDNQKYILKVTLKSWSGFLDDDMDGEPLGHGLVNCGIQDEKEREYCLPDFKNVKKD